MSGGMVLEGEGKETYELKAGDAFVIPPAFKTRFADPTPDFELLEVSLPGSFATEIV